MGRYDKPMVGGMTPMPRRHWPGLLLLLLLPGCSADRQGSRGGSNAPPFIFRSLNLRQQDLLGRATWQLTSPEARYDLRRRVAQVERPRGVIFRDGAPAYRLAASSGTMLNDGEVVLLEGAIRLEQLGRSPMLLRAQRARWHPARQLLELDRGPEAFDASNRLASRRASFHFDTNLLRLEGQPRLEHWGKDIDPTRQQPSGPPEVVLRVQRADWQSQRGGLVAIGPVQASHRPAGRSPDQPAAQLTAAGLTGNTLSRLFRLSAPVRYQDPVDAALATAAAVDLDLRRRLASSEHPFSASRGALQIRGQGFRIDQDAALLTIPIACQLQQAGDALQAARCQFNWRSRAVRASGGVELSRRQNRQLSRAGELNGRLGGDGSFTLRNPDGRVVSQLALPSRPAPVRLVPSRPAPSPIRL